MTSYRVLELTLSGECIATHGSILILENYGIAFDCGTIPESCMNKLMRCRFICITHGHGDHIGRLHSVPFIRKRKNLPPISYILPQVCIEPWSRALDAYSELNGGKTRASDLKIVSAENTPLQVGNN